LSELAFPAAKRAASISRWILLVALSRKSRSDAFKAGCSSGPAASATEANPATPIKRALIHALVDFSVARLMELFFVCQRPG
jgi:hypothetical protein